MQQLVTTQIASILTNDHKIISTIKEFYPKGVSGFSENYYSCAETIKRLKLVNNDEANWDNFKKELNQLFPNSYSSDRTDGAVSNSLHLHHFLGNSVFLIVILISKLGDFYCFYVNHILDKPSNGLGDIATNKNGLINRVWNSLPIEVQKYSGIINVLEKYYPNYSRVDELKLFEIVEDISTTNIDLNKATIFNALFTDNIF